MLIDAFLYQTKLPSVIDAYTKYLCTVLRRLLRNRTPTFLLHIQWDGEHTLPIQTPKTAYCYRKLLRKTPPTTKHQTILLLTLCGDNTHLPFCFQGRKVQSECLSFHMSHHYVVDCGEKGMEKWEAERQSCSLMACKVISCGLVKLKAASLGCNSWQSCPPFTLANPSFRAFSHNQRFMERGRKRGPYEARRKMMTTKRKLQSGTGWKEI